MLKPSDLNYYDLETIAKYSCKGWPVGDYFKEDLIESFNIIQKAIEKAKKK
ncbi:hypothetical protein CPL00221_CDS0059 [Escherichia phage RobRod40]